MAKTANGPTARPNVILVMTDDQGYGDLGCTGNPWIQTPHIDAFHDVAFRLIDFHVSPLCTPTRGALMTGRRPVRNGAWATCWGRSILRRSETTMADIFAANGYATAMFGKWHLGDNYPYRPFDRGFGHVVAHKGGGVGQTPDFWGNNYFDDTYFHNGEPVDHAGYCTDVWFDEALAFIREHHERPFFVYLATNAPHSPYLVAEHYKRPYRNNPEVPEPAFYGMIANIDENLGRLRQELAEMGLEENTILIFMTDNGSSDGCTVDGDGFVTSGYNAGMRGKKGSYYDGGHRVPFFLRWPAGGMQGGRDIDEMALHIDLLPTLIELCELEPPVAVRFDGMSLAPVLRGACERLPDDRVHFLQIRQYTEPPEKWTNAVMTRRWRLVHGRELYDIRADPEQRHDIAERYPEVVARLRAAHEAWWTEIVPGLDAYCPISLGNDAENPTRLNAMDVMGDVAWHQTHIVLAQKSTGRWTVDVEQTGRYRFSLRRWPAELDLPIEGCVSPEEARRHIYASPEGECHAIAPTQALLGLFGQEWVQSVERAAREVCFELSLNQTGVTVLDAWFLEADGERRGAYYVYVERL
ncbi:MAG: arylsulfatase [Anaerolineae bacterium]|nr:arylsulfatase [Anaerolineae bacterium]